MIRRIPPTLAAVLALSALGAAQSNSVPPGGTRNVDNSRLRHGDPYRKPWVEEDVAWIITDEERAAFKTLTNDEQRIQFIDAFWVRRNPTPDRFENEYKVEHYSRIAYANSHFNSRVTGWKTDRGHIYILYGPPDRIESYPSGRIEGETREGDDRSPYPTEIWHYRYLEGVGMDVVIDFVDFCGCGDYPMQIATELRDALLLRPSGLAGGPPIATEHVSPSVFLQATQPVQARFKDLDAPLNGQQPAKAIPFNVDVNFENATTITSLVTVSIALRNRDVTFIDEAELRRGRINFRGRLSMLTGRVVELFEDSIEIPAPTESATAGDEITYIKKTLALPMGLYRVAIAVKDANSDRVGTWSRSLKVASR